jgi:hypothetical protein
MTSGSHCRLKPWSLVSVLSCITNKYIELTNCRVSYYHNLKGYTGVSIMVPFHPYVWPFHAKSNNARNLGDINNSNSDFLHDVSNASCYKHGPVQ